MWLDLQLIFPQVTPDAQSQLQVSVYNLRHQLHQLLVIASGTDWIILWLAGLDTHTSQCFERQLPTMLEHGIGSLIEQAQWAASDGEEGRVLWTEAEDQSQAEEGWLGVKTPTPDEKWVTDTDPTSHTFGEKIDVGKGTLTR